MQDKNIHTQYNSYLQALYGGWAQLSPNINAHTEQRNILQ